MRHGARRGAQATVLAWLEALVRHPVAVRLVGLVMPAVRPLELGLFGRALLLSAVVGLLGGVVGAGFVLAVQACQELVLESWAGAPLLRATGEGHGAAAAAAVAVPWLVLFLPALGAAGSGLLARLAPEIAGGGGDQSIEAFHSGAQVRPRVLPLKLLASVLTLGTGGAGGREGPAMQLGSSAGSLVGWLLPTTARERRMLYVAGLAAGIAAVFRTPLGAALFGVEVLYRDDFETDALVPAVLSSVMGFAVSNALLGHQALFGALPPHAFAASQLPLHAALAVVAALGGAAFAHALHVVRQAAERSALPPWARPALGGLLLGAVVVGLMLVGVRSIGLASTPSALLGGGYGLAQLAVSDAGGSSAQIAAWLLLLAVLRIGATALTVGSGGSAGDFAPAMVIGALLGAAFGHGAQALFPSLGIQPSAFALVGMAALYGGAAHAPLSAVVLVSELAGSYDLLVPLMLATGASHLLLRRVQLYGAQEVNRTRAILRHGQPPTAGPALPARLGRMAVRTVAPAAPLQALREAASGGQPAVPVVDAEGRYLGLVGSDALLALASETHLPAVVAADLAGPPVAVEVGESPRAAAQRVIEAGLDHAPLCDEGRIVGMVSLAELVRVALESPERAEGP